MVELISLKLSVLYIYKITRDSFNDDTYLFELFNLLPQKLQLIIQGAPAQTILLLTDKFLMQNYNNQVKIYDHMKNIFMYIDDLDEVLIIKNISLKDNIDEIELRKYINGNIDISIKYLNDPQLSSYVYSNFSNLSYVDNIVILKNINIGEANMFIEKILFRLYGRITLDPTINTQQIFVTRHPTLQLNNPRGKLDIEHDEIEKLVYEMVLGQKINSSSDIFKLLLLSDFNQAMSYLDRHIEVFPSFIDIVYYELQDTRYYPIMHEKINEVIIDDKLLSKFKDDEISKMYYVLAQIIYNSSIDLSDDEKIAVLEYLFNSGDYADAKELRQRISLGIMGYGINETPGIEINLDIPTLYFLMKTHKK